MKDVLSLLQAHRDKNLGVKPGEPLDIILQEVRKVDKKTICNYTYRYWKGDENHMILDRGLNEDLGESREGYERYKQRCTLLPDGTMADPGQVDVSYSGITSLRTLTDRYTDTVIGYITEEKLSITPQRDEAENLYKEALVETKKILKVEDNTAFEYYVNENIHQISMRDSVQNYTQSIENLIEMINNYNLDEEFQHYLTKIVRK